MRFTPHGVVAHYLGALLGELSAVRLTEGSPILVYCQ